MIKLLKSKYHVERFWPRWELLPHLPSLPPGFIATVVSTEWTPSLSGKGMHTHMSVSPSGGWCTLSVMSGNADTVMEESVRSSQTSAGMLFPIYFLL